MIQLNRAGIVVRWLVVFLEASQVEIPTSPMQEMLRAWMPVLGWTCFSTLTEDWLTQALECR